MVKESVSVATIIPVYNTEPWMLRQCFDSVLNQTIQNVQIIIVDDGSTQEKTRSVLEEYRKTYPKKVQVFTISHAGIAAARNKGIDAAQSEFLCFLDSDDFWERDFVERLVLCAIETGCDVAVCGYQEVDYKGETVVRQQPAPAILQNPENYPYYTCGTGSRIYRTDYVRRNHLRYPEGCIMEDEIFSDLAVAGAQTIPSVISYGYNVRSRSDSVCRSYGTMNTATVQTIPFEGFAAALVHAKRTSSYRWNRMRHRAASCMMSASWLFCCYSSPQERRAVVQRAAEFYRTRIGGILSLVLKHPGWSNSVKIHWLTVLYCLGIRLHLEYPMATLLGALIRSSYHKKG